MNITPLGDHPWPGVDGFTTKSIGISLESFAAKTPAEIIRDICQSKLAAGDVLPPTHSLEIYYVRANDQGTVPFQTTFTYVLDVGWPRLCGVRIPYILAGAGALNFPNFSQPLVLSIESRDPKHLLYPAIAGDILIGVKAGTTVAEISAKLGSIVSNLAPLAPDAYTGRIAAFRETTEIAKIKQAAPFVRYAELNVLQQIIDFQPGWQVDRVI